MYIPAAFRETRPDILHELIRAHSFGTLVSNLDGDLFATHLPFVLDAERNALLGHMARANPHWHAFQEAQAGESVVMFQGPHAYISPSWYLSEEAVPTWNYVAVHAYGTPRVLEDAARVRHLLDATVGVFDTAGWSTARVSEDFIANMTRGIVAFEMPITRLEGKRKLGQNRPAADQRSAASALQTQADRDARAIAGLMLESAASRASD